MTGITGIDNDLALGTEVAEGRAQELPGFSRYVDSELAKRIMALDLGLLPAVFGDVLSGPEIAALIQRFQNLRGKLANANLLAPNQWDAAVAAGLLKENKSYWADIEYHKNR